MIQLSAKDMRTAQPGFTMMEIIVVMMIIGGMLAVLIPSINNFMKQSSVRSAKMALQNIQNAINLYKGDTGKYPTKLRDLVKRPQDPTIKGKWITGGYLGKEEEPNDPWDERYVYKLTPGVKNPYELYSFGPNGRAGSKEDRIDVWELQ